MAHRRLPERLSDSTVEKYNEILAEAEEAGAKSPEALLHWLRNQADPKDSIGTFLPKRAAVRRYLIAVAGFSPADADAVLPDCVGEPIAERRGLSPEQFRTFLTAVEGLDDTPSKVILKLIVFAGLTVGEACSLRINCISEKGLKVHGNRGMIRYISVSDHVSDLVSEAQTKWSKDGFVFGGRTGGSYQPQSVRVHTRKIAEEYKELHELTPAILRHTFAENQARAGASLDSIGEHLGYKLMNSAERYRVQRK